MAYVLVSEKTSFFSTWDGLITILTGHVAAGLLVMTIWVTSEEHPYSSTLIVPEPSRSPFMLPWGWGGGEGRGLAQLFLSSPPQNYSDHSLLPSSKAPSTLSNVAIATPHIGGLISVSVSCYIQVLQTKSFITNRGSSWPMMSEAENPRLGGGCIWQGSQIMSQHDRRQKGQRTPTKWRSSLAS